MQNSYAKFNIIKPEPKKDETRFSDLGHGEWCVDDAMHLCLVLRQCGDDSTDVFFWPTNEVMNLPFDQLVTRVQVDIDVHLPPRENLLPVGQIFEGDQ